MVDDERTDRLEPGGMRTGWVMLAAGGFMLLLFGSLAAFYGIFVAATPRDRTPPHEVPGPRLESNPAVELHALLEKQRKELSDYRWANAEHTVLAIPIDRAMDLIAARGERAFAPLAGIDSATDKPAETKP